MKYLFKQSSLNDRIYRTINISRRNHKKLKLLAWHKQDTIYNLLNNSIKELIKQDTVNIITTTSNNSQTYALSKQLFIELKVYAKKYNIGIKLLILNAVLNTIN